MIDIEDTEIVNYLSDPYKHSVVTEGRDGYMNKIWGKLV